MRSLRIWLLALLSSSGSLAFAAGDEVLVGAAISLQAALEEIKASLKDRKDMPAITFNYASSGALQQQIEQGAPVDLFIAAGQEPIDKLEAKGLLEKGSLVTFLGNSLVLATPAARPADIKDLKLLKDAAFKKIALGAPKTVPAGQYAQDTLDKLGLSEALRPKLVYGSNVKQVLTYVETGDVDAGFVYASDIRNSEKAKLAFTVPAELHRPIVYPAALVKSSKRKQPASLLLKELQSEKSRAVFEKHGFKTQDRPAS